MSHPLVVRKNVRKMIQHSSPSVYIGRPTKWGNPFKIGEVVNGRPMTREDVIARYERWLRDNPVLMSEAKQELRGKTLVCWCAPLPCHGDVLAEIANAE